MEVIFLILFFVVSGIGLRFYAKHTGWHIHDWGNWKFERYTSALYKEATQLCQERQCKTCGYTEIETIGSRERLNKKRIIPTNKEEEEADKREKS